MKNLIRFLSTAAFVLVLTAGAANAQSHEHDARHQSDDIVQSTLIDGVQVVEITVGKTGFSAKEIALKAEMPVRLVFTRTEEGGCAYQVQIPDFGVEATDLPLNEPVAIEFTPQKGGEYTFACGMDMVEGTLLVKS